MIKNRIASFSIIVIVYALAVFCGLFCYDFFVQRYALSYPLALLFADIASTVLVFVFSLIFRNASVYDPYWSVQPPVILASALLKHGGSGVLEVLLFCAVLFWGLRLTANWAYNFRNFEYQDWRYVMLKEKTGVFYPLINLLGIHMFPTLIVYLCILPAVTAVHEEAALKALCIPFIVIAFFAPVIQGIADIQMHMFRKSRMEGFIRTGFWKRSRHPNYAAEIIMWWAVGLACFFAMPDKPWLLVGAAANTLMFLFVSIPMADKRQSRKPGFEAYKKSTRML